MNSSATNIVVGLGITGLSCVRYLTRNDLPCKVVDSRENPPGLALLRKEFPDIEYELGPFDVDTLLGANELLVSPGVSLKTEALARAKQAGVAITGDIDVFSKQVNAPIIAVTGSNGKSTVVSMVGAVLSAAGRSFAVGGNLDTELGKPALDLLVEDRKDFYVLELSSFQLETTENLAAEVATILNLSEDHMDRYADMEEYRSAKLRIFNGCHQIVLNRDMSQLPLVENFSSPVWGFGFGATGNRDVRVIEVGSESWVAIDEQPLFKVAELKVVGRHNLANAMAASALCLAIGIDHAAIAAGLTGFPGLEHRCQWVATIDGVDFYNDSKGTNVGATVAAIQGLGEKAHGKIVLIAGGEGKGADFTPLSPAIRNWVRVTILIGKDARSIAAAIGNDADRIYAADMNEAVNLARSNARAGDAVLLSPACASFDMFENFQQRGKIFAQTVEALQ